MNTIMLIFFVVGALDYLCDNKLKLGQEFENGFCLLGKLLIMMTGFMVLSPIVACYSAAVITPFFARFGCDPSILAGLFLGSDGGGAILAKDLALDEQAGLFNGVIVGSMMGVTIVFSIPMILSNVKGPNRIYATYGLLIGLLSIPFGCILSGIIAGFSLKMVLINSVPVILFNIFLIFIFVNWTEKIIPFFAVIAKVALFIALLGLIIAVIESTTGMVVLKGTNSLTEICPLICSIGIFLAGILPFIAVLQKLLNPVLKKISKKININDVSAAGFIVSLASSIPTFLNLNKMDGKGCMMNCAFLVSASFALGDHLAFTSQFSPELSIPLMVGKVVAGIVAACMAYLMLPFLKLAQKN